MYDYLVIGTGMGGLTIGSLLAKSGKKVLMLEAHEYPGGYAHTFPMGKFKFCAQVHYIFNCGEGEAIHTLLSKLGIQDVVQFNRLDPEGYDHVVIGGERYRIPNGFAKQRDRLIKQFPKSAEPLRRYFKIVSAIRDEMAALPKHIGWKDLLQLPRYRHLLRYRTSTLQDLYDKINMPPKLQAILAGQAGDYLLPPRDVSLILHVGLISGYGKGAYYPTKHYDHFVNTIADQVADRDGCEILYEHEVDKLLTENDKITGVRTTDGTIHRAKNYISNMDPKQLAELIDGELPASYRKKLNYTYSCSSYTIYFGLKNIDLRDYGFGSYNIWHYPHGDINRIYDDQLQRHDYSNPWLFLSTPTLHTEEPGICPPGHQILEVATSADYDYWQYLKDTDPHQYNIEKTKVKNRIMDIIEEQYIPGFRDYVVMAIAGTPSTNARYCWSAKGNAYGAALDPTNVRLSRVPFQTPYTNLWQVNATAGYPSVSGTVNAGMQLYEQLTGDQL